jgi:hypothetical protein
MKALVLNWHGSLSLERNLAQGKLSAKAFLISGF